MVNTVTGDAVAVSACLNSEPVTTMSGASSFAAGAAATVVGAVCADTGAAARISAKGAAVASKHALRAKLVEFITDNPPA